MKCVDVCKCDWKVQDFYSLGIDATCSAIWVWLILKNNGYYSYTYSGIQYNNILLIIGNSMKVHHPNINMLETKYLCHCTPSKDIFYCILLISEWGTKSFPMINNTPIRSFLVHSVDWYYLAARMPHCFVYVKRK
jgi:hypothetical protein